MSRASSQDCGRPTKHHEDRKRFKNKDAVVLAIKRRISLARPAKTATALVAGGASAAILSRQLSRALFNRKETDSCQYWHGNSTAEGNCVAPWTGRTKAEILLHFSWDKTLVGPFGDRLKRLLDPLPLPRMIKKPPPLLVLLGSCATLAFALTYLRHTNRADRYQDRIVGGWIVVAILVGFMSDDGPVQAMTLMPWAIILALGLSSLVHRVLGLKSKAEEGYTGNVAQRPRKKGEQSVLLGEKTKEEWAETNTTKLAFDEEQEWVTQ